MSVLGIGEVATLVNTVIGRVFPDKAEAAKEALDAYEKDLDRQAEADKGQMAVNAAEAANANLFVAGWRPAAGWCCVIVIFCYYVIPTLIGTGFWVHDMLIQGKFIDFPMNPGAIWDLLLGMLGIGTLRTVEKIRGVSK